MALASWDRLDIRLNARRERGELRIRRARPRDIARIAEIEQASFSVPWSPGMFRSLMISERRVLFLVAEGGQTSSSMEDRQILGHAVLWRVADEAELANLAVAPDARGRGIGGEMLDVVLAMLHDAGVSTVFLEVRESNLVALGLYGSRGFQEVGIRKRYYHRPTEDARVLRLDVASSHGHRLVSREATK